MTQGDPQEARVTPAPGVTAHDPAHRGAKRPGWELLALAGTERPSAARLPRIGGEGRALTPRQARAVAALLTTRTYAEAAVRAGVGRRSLFRWRRESPAFRAALAEGIDALRAEALHALAPAIAQTGSALASCTDGSRGLWATLAAARTTLETAGVLEPASAALQKMDNLRKEVRRLEARVAALERAQP